MPYEKCEPASESYFRQNRYLGHFTVCEKLREIWRIADPNTQEGADIRFKCREAMGMTKKMHYKLQAYRNLQDKIDKGLVEKPNYTEDIDAMLENDQPT